MHIAIVAFNFAFWGLLVCTRMVGVVCEFKFVFFWYLRKCSLMQNHIHVYLSNLDFGIWVFQGLGIKRRKMKREMRLGVLFSYLFALFGFNL